MTERAQDVFITVEEAVARIARGEQVIVVDDEDRENEGDLILASEQVNPEAINFMARFGRGLICVSLTADRCDDLGLPLMVEKKHLDPRHRLHGQRRGQGGDHDRYLGSRSCGNGGCAGESGHPTRGPPATWPHVPSAGA